MVSNFDSAIGHETTGNSGPEGTSAADPVDLGSPTGETDRQTNTQTMRQTSEEPLDEGRNRESAVSLRLAITRTARRLRQEAGSTLTPTALATLASIERNSPVTPTRLAEIERVKRPTVTRVISHLTEMGMIDRIPDPEDGRSCRLEITDAGADYLDEQRSRKSAYLTHLLDSLPADQVETLEKAATILESALERGLEDRGR